MQFTELTNDQLISIAPAVAAANPYHEVSARYDFVPTLAVVDLLRECDWLPVHADQAGVRKAERDGFQKHIIRFRHANTPTDARERIDLMLYNSHDRGCAFNLTASVWRQVCGNGLMVAADYANFKHNHINFDGEAMAESAISIAKDSAMIAAEVDEMKAIEMQPDEKGVYALAAHQLIYEDSAAAPIRPEQLLREHRYDDKGNDLWTAFNVVQENIIKGGIRGFNPKTRKRVTTRPVKAIDRNIKLNKALWTLTEKMKELKAA